MKKTATLFLIFIFLCVVLNAQETDRSQRVVETQTKQINYILEQLQLPPQVVEMFLPLYEEFRDKRMLLLREFRKERQAFNQLAPLIETDYEKIVESGLRVKIEEAKLTQEYYILFKKSLTPKQLYDLMRAEESFAKEFLKRERDYKEEKKK